MKRYFVLLLSVLLVNTSFCQDEKPEFIKVGQGTPHFNIKTLDGKTIDTKALKGKVIYLNFFATWCPPCIKELPHVEKEIWKAIKNEDFVMVAIGREHTKEELVKFKNKNGFTFPMAADENREVFSKFAHQNIPRNVIIDKKGKIRYSKHGFDEEKFGEMVKLINELLSTEE